MFLSRVACREHDQERLQLNLVFIHLFIYKIIFFMSHLYLTIRESPVNKNNPYYFQVDLHDELDRIPVDNYNLFISLKTYIIR